MSRGYLAGTFECLLCGAAIIIMDKESLSSPEAIAKAAATVMTL